MFGKRGLIMGVANDHSIAWGIAEFLHRQGAELAFTYQGEALGRRVQPLAESVGSNIVVRVTSRMLGTSTPLSMLLPRNGPRLISSSTRSLILIRKN